MNVYTSLVRIHYRFLNVLLELIRSTLFQEIKPDASSVLVVRKGNLGDVVCSFPAFEAIKRYFPNATIDLLTTHGIQSSIGASSIVPEGYVNKVYEYRSFSVRSLYNLIRQQRYAVVIELPPDVDTVFNQLRNMFFFRMAGIPSGGGWCITRTSFLRRIQLQRLQFDSEQVRLQRVLKSIGIKAGLDTYPPLYTFSDKEQVTKLFNGTVPPRMVCIAVGAKLEKKKWPLSSFREVVTYLTNHGYTTVAVGDVSDWDAAHTAGVSPIYNFCGKLSVAESAALLSLCTFTVCNDSGPMHLSYAVGTPVYAIFSARNYKGKWNPPADGRNQVFVDYKVPCAGCMNKPCSDNICMKQIEPEQVIQSIHRNLYP